MSHTHAKVSLDNNLSAGCATHPGRGRAVNEDSLGLPKGIPQATLARKGHLYIVADGVGGYQAGDVASQMAVEIIRRVHYQDPDPDIAASLQSAVAAANAEIYRQAQQPAYAQMGTTVVAAVARGDELIVANAGDSRAYLLHGGALQQLTSDHTWVAERVAAGLLTPEEAARHDMRHIVTRSLGAEPTVEVDVRSHRLLPGDRLLLCSDGVWEPVAETEKTRLLRHGKPQAAAAALVNQAVAAGGADDATALVVEVGPARAGVLGQMERVIATVMASPQQRALVIGLGAVLILALIICSVTRLFPRRAAQVLPMATLTQTAQASPIPTIPPATPTTTTAPSTATPLPEPAATSTAVPAPTISVSERYCILPSKNPAVGPDFPANALDPSNCVQIPDTSIPVNADIGIPDKSIIQDCGKPIIQVTYGGHSYSIFPDRVGRRYSDGSCQDIPDWRDFFRYPRHQ